MAYKSKRFVFCCVIFATACLFFAFGCNRYGRQGPQKNQLLTTVATVLPSYLTLLDIDAEYIPVGPNALKVNFKAVIGTKESLYQVERVVEGTPRITLLTMVRSAECRVSVYGCLEAVKTVDKWTLSPPDLQLSNGQFGLPRGTFDALAYVTGSKEAEDALKQQEANAEAQHQSKIAALERQERERVASETLLERERQAKAEREERERKALKETNERLRAEQEAERQKVTEKKRLEEMQKRAARKQEESLDHVERMERTALDAVRDAQREAASRFSTLQMKRDANQRAIEAKQAAAEARKEYESAYPSAEVSGQ